VPANGDQTIRRNGQGMSLSNGGDTIDLVAPNGQVAHSVSYGHADEGDVIQFPP
jgi:hypothetical protein